MIWKSIKFFKNHLNQQCTFDSIKGIHIKDIENVSFKLNIDILDFTLVIFTSLRYNDLKCSLIS